jgi:serine/threonine protein kinase
LKAFDFGLAKELRPEDVKEDGRYELTGNTGSRRYMAPEVAKECHYDKSVDVYSFGILLWELCSTEKPFFGYSSNKHMQKVVLGGERPKMDGQHTSEWPTNLKWLLSRCWSAFPAARPSFTDIKDVLRDILHEKDAIPPNLAILEEAEHSEEPIEEFIKEGSGLFGGLFRSPRLRGKSEGKHESDSGPSFSNISPVDTKSGRSKSWGFVHRR